MGTSAKKFIHWVPRVLAILFLAFMTLFSLDVIEPGRSAAEIAVGLFMHNIPVMILAAALWVSWRREIVGTVVFLAIGLLLAGRMLLSMIMSGVEQQYLGEAIFGILLLGLPPFVIGALFFTEWHLKRKGLWGG